MSVVDWSHFGRPCVGETVSGDSAVVVESDNLVFLGIVDVLGHGPEAYPTARQAQNFLREHWTADVVSTMMGLHEDLRGTRGAAAGLGIIDLSNGRLSYCAVGNIVARKVGTRSMHLGTTEGIVGQSIKRLSAGTTYMEASDLLLLYSDGIPDRFSLDELVELRSRDAWAIARHLVREYGRTFDDATCIALRYER